MRTLIAYTSEIDDVEAAVEEVLGQLGLSENLGKHAVGVIACHYEFVLSGVVKKICEALPFDVAGTITNAQAVNGASGTLMLTLTVLTGDDISFRTVLSDSLLGEPAKTIERAYQAASAQMAERPALILSYAGFMVENSGDEYVEVITRVSGGAPCFGTLAVDDTTDFSSCYVLFNGTEYRDRMALILIYGNLSPRFYIATLSEEKVITDKPALITASQGHILQEVNGKPLTEYFEDLGLTKASETSYAMTSLPFMLDYGDGTPQVSKVFIGLTEEKHAICAGAMPVGSTLYMGVFDRDDVLLTTGRAVKKALAEAENPSGILVYSCISRNMTLGGEPLAEIELTGELVGDIPFMMAYSGGEMCPTLISEQQAVNRFHNNAYVLCIF